MQILFIGDIFGSAGRKIVRDHLSHVVETNKVDLVVANAENAAGGFGLTPTIADEIFDMGCDVLTTGNHIWDKREIVDYFNSANGDPRGRARRVLRPANYAEGVPGVGLYEGATPQGQGYAVINLQGRVFMPAIDCPFRTVDGLLESIPATVKLRLVDIHAEATSEKLAMGWHLDGRVTAVVGTHTHVPTADEIVLPAGTAYITDLGMTGPYESVIGIDKDIAVRKFLSQLPERFEVAEGDVRLCGVVVEADARTGRAVSIERVVRK